MEPIKLEKRGIVFLTATWHNWGEYHAKMEASKMFFILYDNGQLRYFIYKGRSIAEKETRISERTMNYIRSHIENAMHNISEIDGNDGEAWQVDYNGMSFGPGYVYDTELERITNTLKEKT